MISAGKSGDTDEVSGYINRVGEESISSSFTDIRLFSMSEFCILLRAKREGRWWLLKGLRKELADRGIYREMLRKEYDILSRLQHPGIVKAYECVWLGGEYAGLYIVMEWIEGETLDKWLTETHTFEERKDLCRQLLSAVGYIHSTGIVHRDLKPANIMVSRNGNYLYIIDFGLSDSDFYSILKQPGGTEGYMAPEQCIGGNPPDVRNDIYSIGLILQDLNPGKRYNGIIRRCISPIEARYPNIGHLSKAFSEASSRKSPIGVIGASLILIIGVGGAVWYGFHKEREREGAQVATTAISGEASSAIPSEDSLLSTAPSAMVSREAAPSGMAEALATSGMVGIPENKGVLPSKPVIAEKVAVSSDERKVTTTSDDTKVNDLIAEGIRIFEEAAVGIESQIDTLSRRKYLRGYELPKQSWKEFYYERVPAAGLTTNDEYDRVYSALEHHTTQRYEKWDKKLSRIEW